jgi:alkylation response protein AidB-like acyl-CoA dehydrogenase
MFCSQAPIADVLVTMATYDDPDTGTTVLAMGIPTSSPGVSVVETWDTLGMRATASHDVQLDDVPVAEAQISARRPWGKLDKVLLTAGVHFAPTVASVYFGVAAAARDEAVRIVGERRNGDGQPLAQDPASQRLIGQMDQKLKVAWWALMGALSELGDHYTPDEETMNLVMIAKRQIVTEAIEVVSLAMDAVGGSSYFRRSPLEQAYRDVRAGTFHPLNPEKTLLFAGRLALGQPVDTIW